MITWAFCISSNCLILSFLASAMSFSDSALVFSRAAILASLGIEAASMATCRMAVSSKYLCSHWVLSDSNRMICNENIQLLLNPLRKLCHAFQSQYNETKVIPKLSLIKCVNVGLLRRHFFWFYLLFNAMKARQGTYAKALSWLTFSSLSLSFLLKSSRLSPDLWLGSTFPFKASLCSLSSSSNLARSFFSMASLFSEAVHDMD